MSFIAVSIVALAQCASTDTSQKPSTAPLRAAHQAGINLPATAARSLPNLADPEVRRALVDSFAGGFFTAPDFAVIATTTPPSRNGPFAIGRRNLIFVDATRKTPANGNIPERPSRTLETIIEYPAQGAPGPAVEITDAAPAAGTFPVVMFVHGFGAHADNTYLHYWAAAGFIAVSIKFPLTNTDAPGGPTYADTFNEPGDVRFVLDRIAHLPARNADLQPSIDATSVGLVGQSLGAGVVFAMGYNDRYHDPRIKAVVPISGGCVGCLRGLGEADGRYFAGPSVPLLLIHGTADAFAPIQQSAQTYAQAPAPKFFLRLIGAEHIWFGTRWESIGGRATIDFLDRYLKNEADALQRLTKATNVPGIAHLEQALG